MATGWIWNCCRVVAVVVVTISCWWWLSVAPFYWTESIDRQKNTGEKKSPNIQTFRKVFWSENDIIILFLFSPSKPWIVSTTEPQSCGFWGSMTWSTKKRHYYHPFYMGFPLDIHITESTYKYRRKKSVEMRKKKTISNVFVVLLCWGGVPSFSFVEPFLNISVF